MGRKATAIAVRASAARRRSRYRFIVARGDQPWGLRGDEGTRGRGDEFWLPMLYSPETASLLDSLCGVTKVKLYV
jgi:hypothetical protein